MTPGFALAGSRPPGPPAREWLGRLAFRLEASGDLVQSARPCGNEVRVAVHPAAPDVVIAAGPDRGVTVRAGTFPAGPGYHAMVLEVVLAAADDFGVDWDEVDDSTGYTEHGDFARLELAFDAHLAAAARGWLVDVNRGHRPAHALPTSGVRFLHPGCLLTPSGPRSAAWLRLAAADPARARDLFAWPSFDVSADVYRTRALALLWTRFPFRPPLTEDEGELCDQIAADLDAAFGHDPGLDYPFAAWAEVLAALDADAGTFTVQQPDAALRREVSRRARLAVRPDSTTPVSPGHPAPVGYRRGPVRVALGDGWAVTVPGSLCADATGNAWTAFDADRRVTVSPDPVAPPADGWTRATTVTVDGRTRHLRLSGAPGEWADAVSLGRECAGIGVRRAG